jgi:hypothetical protein
MHGQSHKGLIKVVNQQTWHPYNTDFDVNHSNNYGLYDRNEKFTPWNEYGEWIYDAPITPFCGENGWYSNNQTLTGNVVQWQNDIYGNQYFLLSPTGTRLSEPDSYKQLYVKPINQKTKTGAEFLANIFEKYNSL